MHLHFSSEGGSRGFTRLPKGSVDQVRWRPPCTNVQDHLCKQLPTPRLSNTFLLPLPHRTAPTPFPSSSLFLQVLGWIFRCPLSPAPPRLLPNAGGRPVVVPAGLDRVGQEMSPREGEAGESSHFRFFGLTSNHCARLNRQSKPCGHSPWTPEGIKATFRFQPSSLPASLGLLPDQTSFCKEVHKDCFPPWQTFTASLLHSSRRC